MTETKDEQRFYVHIVTSDNGKESTNGPYTKYKAQKYIQDIEKSYTDAICTLVEK
jgi:hypothetical protein